MNKRKIIWQNLNLSHDAISGMITDDNDEFKTTFEEKEEEKYTGGKPEKNLYVRTQGGIYHILDAFNPLKQYVMWYGHTNFDLSKREIENLVKVPGIEKLKIVTRYRFMIAVGRAFTFPEVRIGVQEALKINDSAELEEE
jgi:hypothetical protein